ncbi:pyruvate kinase [Drosophila pseudoobscura]|uniref:Pyruvate kinase n=1 Tax=Drosophila pseudoobscura pseudoobscura TaxID=46245 RepID=A0A6I8UPN6_DROPS|nr:pyruvate kinase [Drosophila pseudoobscura]
MRVVRLNFSHGSHEYHSQTIKAARKAIDMYAKQTGVFKPVAIALDTKGPEIRTGKIEGGDTSEIELKQGDSIKLSTNKELQKKCNAERVYVDYKKLPSIIKTGDRVYIDDGLIALKVKQVAGDEVTCEVENGGKLGSHKGVNLPGVAVDLPAVSEKDKADLKFGVEQKVDMVFASFIRDAQALAEIRNVLGPEGKNIKIISKIENQQGMANIDSIITASDGIMVARGDLGIEILTDEVPLAQKAIIAKCNQVGKPVICATQMLDSMIGKPRPTRAEASDVANAIFDGADCVMLSGETAKGKYPVECIKCMAKICSKVEAVLWYESIQNNVRSVIRMAPANQISAVSMSIVEAATTAHAKAIIVASPCSMIPQLVSQMRPACPIVMLIGCKSQARQSVIFRGIYPVIIDEMATGCTDFGEILKMGIKLLPKLDIMEPGKKVTVVIVDAMRADKISFGLFSVRQQTKAEMEKQAAEGKKKQPKKCIKLLGDEIKNDQAKIKQEK